MAQTIQNFSAPSIDPLRNFRFLVEITALSGSTLPAGFDSFIGFTSVEGLSLTIDAIPYREGGYNTTTHQLPGQATFSPITLSRGVVLGTSQNHAWTKQLFTTLSGSGTGTAGANFRVDVGIRVLDHPVTSGGAALPPTKIYFKVYNAWITSLAYSGLNAGDNAIFVEQMTLAHEGWDANWVGTGTAAATAPAS